MALVLGQAGPHMWPAMVLTLRTHPGPGSVAGLLVDKLNWIGHWYEIPNNTNYYYYARRAPILIALAALTLAMGWFALQLRMDAGFDKQMPRSRPRGRSSITS